MNFSQFYFKHLFVNKQAKGFTLTELLVAIAISGLVLAGLGTGMVAVLNSSNRTSAETEVKNQLNRAIDYIQSDIARSRIASRTQTKTANDTVVLTYYTSESSTVAHTIEYYLDDVGTSSPWLGPKVLKRRVNVSGAPVGDWQVLVDGITENNVTSNFVCDDALANTQRIGTTDGFQYCIEQGTGTNSTNVYRIKIGLFGEILDTEGTNTSSDILAVNVDAIARSITPTVSPPEIGFTPSTDLSPLLTWNPVLGADSYSIFRCTTIDITCVPTSPDSGILTGTSYQAANPPDTERACYHGVSLSSGNQGSAGNVVCTIINPATIPPNISGANFTVSSDIVPTVSWDRDTETVDYHLYRCATTNPAAPCTITVTDPSTDANRIATFTAPTDTAFDANIPWKETATPNTNEAFCYGVVAENEKGLSVGQTPATIPVVKCGILNATEVIDPLWDIQFINFGLTSSPQDITWTDAGADATKYRIKRCRGVDCNPELDGELVLDGNPNPLEYDESITPDPGEQFCYQVQAVGTGGRISPYSTKRCGELEATLCTLNLAKLGANRTGGSITSLPNVSGFPLLQTPAQIQGVVDVVTVEGGFDNPPIQQDAFIGFNILTQVIVNGSQRAGEDSIDIACNSVIVLVGDYP